MNFSDSTKIHSAAASNRPCQRSRRASRVCRCQRARTLWVSAACLRYWFAVARALKIRPLRSWSMATAISASPRKYGESCRAAASRSRSESVNESGAGMKS